MSHIESPTSGSVALVRHVQERTPGVDRLRPPREGKGTHMGKRLAIVIGAAALGVIALGAQTAAAAPQVVKYDTQLGMYAERGGLYDGYVKSEARKCTEGRRV